MHIGVWRCFQLRVCLKAKGQHLEVFFLLRHGFTAPGACCFSRPRSPGSLQDLPTLPPSLPTLGLHCSPLCPAFMCMLRIGMQVLVYSCGHSKHLTYCPLPLGLDILCFSHLTSVWYNGSSKNESLCCSYLCNHNL